MIRLCAFADEADRTLSGQIEALKRNGISLIEVRAIEGVNVKDFTLQQAKEYAETLRQNGISVWSIGSPLGKVDISVDFETYLDTCRHVFEVANVFGAKYVRAFSFFNAYKSGEKVLKNLQKMVALASKYGLTLCHENEKEIYGDTLLRVQEILQKVDGVQAVFDPANYVEVGEDVVAALHALAPTTQYYHIKDCIRKTNEKVPSGLGDGQIPLLLSYASTQDTVLTLEPHLAVFEGYAQIDNTEMKVKFSFENSHAAFDAAVNALKQCMASVGLREVEGGFCK